MSCYFIFNTTCYQSIICCIKPPRTIGYRTTISSYSPQNYFIFIFCIIGITNYTIRAINWYISIRGNDWFTTSPTKQTRKLIFHTLYSSPNSSTIFFPISFFNSSASSLSFENSPLSESISSRNSSSVIPSSSITTPT